jgi:hypothetical protein
MRLPRARCRFTRLCSVKKEAAVLTFEDCLGLCDLTEEEIRAIAEHEHLAQIVALELGQYLMRGPDGELLVSHMFIDDIRLRSGAAIWFMPRN